MIAMIVASPSPERHERVLAAAPRLDTVPPPRILARKESAKKNIDICDVCSRYDRSRLGPSQKNDRKRDAYDGEKNYCMAR